MPKKPGAGGSSKAAAAKSDTKPANEPDDSFIVFTNSKSNPKSGKGPSKATENPPTTNSGPIGTEPKKPTVKQLVGGASWTGKLPVNILSEHCQKQKWDRPDYSMRRDGELYSSVVTLRATNPKTREATTLPPFLLPPDHKSLTFQPTAVEARNFAATYALFRICSMKNIQMMLPPTYRDLWKNQFTDLKKEDCKAGKDWMYAADPFSTFEERNKAKAAQATIREKKLVQSQKQKQETEATPGGRNSAVRGWSKSPLIELGEKTRYQIEALIRKEVVWNPHDVEIGSKDSSILVKQLETLGFRRSHAEEAVACCKDKEEALEWLLIYVPEDDLPKWSLPGDYTAGISLASTDLKREAAVKRLVAAGYSSSLVEKCFDQNDQDEAKAREVLQQRLLTPDVSLSFPEQDAGTAWDEEQEVLESLYGDRYVKFGTQCCVKLDVSNPRCTLFAEKPSSGAYPGTMPIIKIESEPKLPAYIRLSIVRQTLEYARSNLLGEQMVYLIIEWLESNIKRIIENPGSLKDVLSSSQKTEERKDARRAANLRYSARRTPDTRRGMDILRVWKEKQSQPNMIQMMQQRRSLPAWQKRDEIITAVRNYQATIITGETGSGKSTQCVQFILDDMIQDEAGQLANLVCTQPRRISALGLADRVSDERCMPVGTEVGYSIRGESKLKAGLTKISFVTTGVLLRRLQGGDTLAALADVSHVIIDEVHERSLDTDFLLRLLKDVMKRRKDLKVILMSATLDAATFADYFGGQGKVGQVEISGRTFPVEDWYLDDVLEKIGAGETRIRDLGIPSTNYDLLADLIEAIDMELGTNKGGILVFLPGTLEISRAISSLRRLESTLWPLPLHASLLPNEQKRVFLSPPPGKRKVVVATNVAETSITIPDIVAVIDSGRVKETSFDAASGLVKLAERWASKAACRQRRGRAGRVAAGTCYKLFTRHVEAAEMADRPEPEIRRVSLEQLCLAVKAMNIDNVPEFLARTLSPPDALAVDKAIVLLHRMEILDQGKLTALGRHVSSIPADLRLGKLLVYGALFSCVEDALTLAAVLTVRSPFNSSPNVREESKAARLKFSQRNDGDLLTDMRAFNEWDSFRFSYSRKQLSGWCETNFVSSHTLWDIASNRDQYASALRELGFSVRTSRKSSQSVLRAIIAGSFSPQICRIAFPDAKYAASASGSIEIDPEARTIKYFSQDERVFVHPSSSLFDAQSFGGSCTFMAFFEKMATSKVFIKQLTPLNAMALLLFGGPLELDTLGRGVTVDGWMRLRGWARIGVLVSRLRGLLDDLLADMIDSPGSIPASGKEIIDMACHLIEYNGLDR